MNNLLTLLAALILAAEPAVRAPAAARQFYPAKPKELAALVERELAAVPAPELPADAKVLALLVPHAGLEYSGTTAARAFKALKKGDFDSVLLLGTAHYKELEGAALYPGQYWPGLPYDAALAKALLAASPLIKADAAAHKKEHSIEVELPFVEKTLGKIPMAALILNTQDLESARQLGHAIAKAVAGKRVLIVASSDQSHYPSGGIGDAVDRSTLLALETLDPAYFWLSNRFLMNRGLPHLAVTYCGEGAVTAMLTAAKDLGATRARTLAHINSGDVVSEREYNHVVGYAAAVVTSEGGAPAPARPPLSDKTKAQLLRTVRQVAGEAALGRKAAAPLSANAVLNLPAAVFVTLRDKKGGLRGCVGSVEPQDSLLEAVARYAAAAATSDGRFKPLTAEEAKDVKAEVSVLSPLRAVKDASEIKPGDGVSLDADGKTGVFLPDVWKDLPKKDDFLSELCVQKAGLKKDCWKNATVKVFSADTFSD